METELTKKESFELLSTYEGMDENLKAEIKEELEDFDDVGGIECRKIKIPTGKSKAFEVESENPDDPDMEKELLAVILLTHKMNSRWEGDYNNENRMPVCSSWDAKQGMNLQTGEIKSCDTCSYNTFHRDGMGKKCKNTRRIYLILNGNPHLYILTVPPTSLNSVNKQLKRIIESGVPLTRTIVAFRLEAATSKGGKDYAKITVEKVGELTQEQGNLTRQMREKIKKQYAVAVNNGNQASTEGFINIPEDTIDQELPFH